ncbi:MAG: hypothetical protein FWF96_07305 [Kiritimatiellaeota bacterium]|nr:hypothetical protein [Kiritimatiellota bacterium]
MKIKPLKSYPPPAYPTRAEAKQDARLLENPPRRCGKGNPLATLIGTGFLFQIAGTGCRDKPVQNKDVETPVVEPLERNQPPARAAVVRAVPVTRVAPILEDALANDGRGAFGCDAVSAPIFLSENEAVDLIEAELEKTGLKFHDIVTVEGLRVPTTQANWDDVGNLITPKTEDGSVDWEEREKFKIKNLAEGAYTFDLGTADKSVVVKFLRTKDYQAWDDNHFFMMSSVSSYDLSSLASQVRDAFAQRETGDPVVIGIFFEPLTHPEPYNENEKDTKARAKEKLRGQVRHFVEYLKQEGVVE